MTNLGVADITGEEYAVAIFEAFLASFWSALTDPVSTGSGAGVEVFGAGETEGPSWIDGFGRTLFFLFHESCALTAIDASVLIE